MWYVNIDKWCLSNTEIKGFILTMWYVNWIGYDPWHVDDSVLY